MITTQYCDDVLARARAHNTENGKCMTALRKVFENALSGVYPEGTNIVVEFIRELIPLPYGDNGLSLDYRADCSQLCINVLHYFFGIDNLGSYTESIYFAEGGTFYDNVNEAPPLTIILYNFKAGRNASHASMKMNSTQIAHTRSTSKPLMFDNLTYSLSSIVQIRDFLTLEQHNSVLVGNVDENGVIPGSKKNNEVSTVGEVFSRELKFVVPMLHGDDVRVVQQMLITSGYPCGKKGIDGYFGSDTERAKQKYQKDRGIDIAKPLRLKLD